MVEVLVPLARVAGIEETDDERDTTDAPESVRGSLSSSEASYAGESTLVRKSKDEDAETCIGCFEDANERFGCNGFEFAES